MNRKLLASILLILANFFAVNAFADWTVAFPPDAVKTYLSTTNARVMVVSVGADEAAAALTQSLSGSAVVMGGAALGDVSSLGDSDIAEKAKGQPVDQIVIVRQTGEGEAATAIVTVYAADGTSLGGFTASAGQPAPVSDGGGASQSEMSSAVAEAERGGNDPSSRDKFLDSFVGFDDWVGINQYGAVVSQWTVPFKGRDKIPLKGAKFYDEIRQPELAKKYRKRATTRTVIALTSTGLMLGGLVVALVPLFQTADCAVADGCDRNLTPLWVGLGMVGVGTIGLTIAPFINPNPVDPATARKLAREHNERLAEELGIDLELLVKELTSRPPSPKPEFKIGFAPLPNGGGVGVSARF